MLSRTDRLCAAAGALLFAAPPQQPRDPTGEVVRGYASWCHHLYGECEQRALDLRRAIGRLLERPGAETLQAARGAWVAGRRVYGMTEVFRFYDGPIEEREPIVNAWPVDEAYIDAVRGQPDAGIVNDRVRFPGLGEAVLVLANERGGEANICTGWHAIEFMLWGQDFDPLGPGCRSASDFDPELGKNAIRRREYLTVITELLVRQLGELRAAWAPDADNYRRRFEADPKGAVRRMLTGAIVLTAFELNGERLAVAYETQDQEQEHSCFSDTTCEDLLANQRGIEVVFTGQCDGRSFGPGLLALVEGANQPVAADLRRKLATTAKAMQSIPQPFDQAFLGTDSEPGRTALRAAMAALEEQTDALSIAGRLLGFELPLKPGG